MNATQRPGVLKWSFLVIIVAVIIVFFNIGQEEIIDEAITAEDTEAKKLNDKTYHLLRPKVKDQEDIASVVVHDKREKEQQQEVVVELNHEQKDKNESLTQTTQPAAADDSIDSSEAEENDEEETATAEDTTEVEEASDETLHQSAPDVDEQEMSQEEPAALSVVQSSPADEEEQKMSQDNDDGSFTIERLKATREAAQNLLSMLEQYYNGVEQSKNMMLDSWLVPWNFDKQTNDTEKIDTDKIVMKDKIVDTMARALVTNDQKEFIIGTIGSSVAAGHDNCNFDSYERQMERTFGPVWEAAGMKLVCENAGEGGGCGDDFANQVFCIKQNVSPNIDIAQ